MASDNIKLSQWDARAIFEEYVPIADKQRSGKQSSGIAGYLPGNHEVGGSIDRAGD
jgi:hypothetical protein